MPNVKKKVPWDSNITARSLSLLKSDRPITLKNSTYGEIEEETRTKFIERSYMDSTEADINQNYQLQISHNPGRISPIMESTIPKQRKDSNDQQRAYTGCATLCERIEGNYEMVSSSSENYLPMKTNYYTSMDHCDESSRDNKCSQLLHSSFPTTTVPNAVASFSSSSSTSASSQETPFLPRRGRLKEYAPNKRISNGRILRRQSSLLSFMSRQFFVYRRNCHSVVGDAVLTFMLFLAMLHLSW